MGATLIILLVSYLLGAIPFGYLVARGVKKVDIRQIGSGNTGARNVGRILGFKWGLLIFFLDMAKGFLAVVMAVALLHYIWRSPDKALPLDCLLAGLAAVIGHSWSVFLRLGGGKGASTSVGALLGWLLFIPLMRYYVLASVVVAVPMLVFMRRLTLSACAATLVFYVCALGDPRFMAEGKIVLLGLAFLLVYRHRSNIARLYYKRDRMRPDEFVYKIADAPDELRQIHQLNYSTFVQEIPQHAPNEEQMLVDKFHQQNTYYIAKHKNEVVGMFSLNGRRPFSLDHKVPALDDYLPKDKKIVEIRLLSIKKQYRRTPVFRNLMKMLYYNVIKQGYEVIIASCALRELKLYSNMGFVPFAGVVGTEKAPYQPMFLEMDKVRERAAKLFAK